MPRTPATSGRVGGPRIHARRPGSTRPRTPVRVRGPACGRPRRPACSLGRSRGRLSPSVRPGSSTCLTRSDFGRKGEALRGEQGVAMVRARADLRARFGAQTFPQIGDLHNWGCRSARHARSGDLHPPKRERRHAARSERERVGATKQCQALDKPSPAPRATPRRSTRLKVYAYGRSSPMRSSSRAS